MSNQNATYVIPDYMQQLQSGKAAWALVVTTALGAVGGAITSTNVLEGAGEGAVMGFLAGIPITIAIGVGRGLWLMGKVRAVWAKHTYAWYRQTFPEHAHEKGRVSCRHCGGTHINVRNLMNQTFMRAHSCAQCGETLYFSAEKV